MASKAKPKEEVKFRAVYFLASEHLREPAKIKVVYVVDQDNKEGDVVRAYPKREKMTTGFTQGVWGKNFADTKSELGAFCMLECDAQAEIHQKRHDDMRAAEKAWSDFLEEA